MCEKKCINDERNLKRTNKRLFTESTNIILERRFVSVFSLSFAFCPRRLICFNLFNQSIVFGWWSFGHVHICDAVFSSVAFSLYLFLSLFLFLNVYVHLYTYIFKLSCMSPHFLNAYLYIFWYCIELINFKVFEDEKNNL